jgi:V8-like Glu-specific endopeptidase
MKLSGPEWIDIRGALCDAFPSYRDLERLLRDYFGENIDHHVAHNGNLKDAVDDIIKWFSARDRIPDLVKAAFIERPENFSIQRIAQKWADIPVLPEQAVLERLFRQSNGFLDPEIWFIRFRDNINCVCQIEIKFRSGYSFGSGVLVAPNIVLTNYHVIECVAEPEKFRENGEDAQAADVIIRFDKRKGLAGYIQPGVEHRLHNDWLIASSPYSQFHLEGHFDNEDLNANNLDYALLRLGDSPGEQITTLGMMEFKRGWVRLNSQISSNLIGGGLIVVQYPEGETLKVSIDTEVVLENNQSGSRIKHKVNTTNGSSGAPCFNLNWDLVAIHQAGVSPTSFQKGYNIAIPIPKIISSIQEKGLSDSLGLFV